MQFPLYMQHHQFELISGVYAASSVSSSCQHSSGQHHFRSLACKILKPIYNLFGLEQFTCYWVEQFTDCAQFGVEQFTCLWVEQFTCISMILKPIYLHYLYLNMHLQKVYLDVVPAVYARLILKIQIFNLLLIQVQILSGILYMLCSLY